MSIHSQVTSVRTQEADIVKSRIRQRIGLSVTRGVAFVYQYFPFTWFAVAVDLGGVANPMLAGAILACGCVGDVIRMRFSPDIARGLSALGQDLDASATDEVRLRNINIRQRAWQWPLHGFWCGYIIVFSIAEPLVPQSVMTPYLHFFQPLYAVMGKLVSVIREHPQVLIAHGDSFRALVVEHVYSVNFLMFSVVMMANISRIAYLKLHLMNKKTSQKVSNQIFEQRAIYWRSLVLLNVLGMCGYILFGRLIEVAFQARGPYSWTINSSNFLFSLQTMCLEGICGCFLYQLMLSNVFRLIWFKRSVACCRFG